MDDNMVVMEEIDSVGELKNILSKENIIEFDEVQNTCYKISIGDKFVMGVAYCSHGIRIDYKMSNDGSLLFMGIGIHLLCIDVANEKILFSKKLQSVFYEIIADSKHNFLCIVCELDIYCYGMGVEVWKLGFRDVITDFNIIDDETIYVLCADEEYNISIYDGKVL